MINGYREVNCATISDSGAVMAVGMATSIVHVFIMSKKNHDIIVVDDMIKM